MPAYTGTHRHPPAAGRRRARADWAVGILTAILLAAVAALGVFFAVRYGAAFIRGGP